MTVQALPSGVTPDKAALLGLVALMANVNAYADTRVDITTAGTDSTLTGAQATGGVVFLASGASAGFTITLPTTKALITALGPTIPLDGTFSKRITFVNVSVGQTGTLTAGDASTTITGTATILTATTRTFLMTVNTASTVTFQNMGSMAA